MVQWQACRLTTISHGIDEFKLKQDSKGPTKDGTYKESFGGTELMNKALYERVDKDLLEQFNIIKSRVREVSEDKPNILWLHDLWNDPSSSTQTDRPIASA